MDLDELSMYFSHQFCILYKLDNKVPEEEKQFGKIYSF